MTGFTTAVRDSIREGTRASAEVLVPILAGLVPNLTHVVDVGCGEGWWCKQFELIPAVDAVGVDHADTVPVLGGDQFVRADLRRPLQRLGTFDLALCLEVAEHLPAERAPGLVADLCALAPVVAFSAAIPGQGGVGHVNCQWPGYWDDLFADQGYRCSGALRYVIWGYERVECWYRQNLLVAWDPTRDPGMAYRLPEIEDRPPRPLVHPDIWNAYRFPPAPEPVEEADDGA